MKSKDLAMAELLSLLESRYAMRLIWALRDGHPQTFRLLQDSIGGVTPNTLNTRLKAMREHGLVAHSSAGYHITALGADLIRRMSDFPPFASKWQQAIKAKKSTKGP